MISLAQIQVLYDRYLDLIKMEVEQFGVKATEVRHLIGRLGEFYCALKVGGSLAPVANQPGFDVVCRSGRRISVKATAQKTGFVAISSKTLNKVDDVMVLQYVEGRFEHLYYGPVAQATQAARFYEPTGNFELDISKARQLVSNKIDALQAQRRAGAPTPSFPRFS